MLLEGASWHVHISWEILYLFTDRGVIKSVSLRVWAAWFSRNKPILAEVSPAQAAGVAHNGLSHGIAGLGAKIYAFRVYDISCYIYISRPVVRS